MKNILVTGGAGFIGSNFIHYMLKHDPDVFIVNLDAMTYAGNEDNLRDLPDPKRHILRIGNICDSELVNSILQDNKFNIDAIVHFAAETHVDRSIVSPDSFIQTNVVGTHTLLEQARKHGVRFHHISTDEVYGSLMPLDRAWTEKSGYSPNSPYSASKAASDYLVKAYGHTYGLEYTITNCSNNYGLRQYPEKLIPLTITNALKGEAIPVYGDGEQIRDWIYVEDHCEALRLVLERGKAGETYNIGGNNQTMNISVICDICKILDEILPDSEYCPHEHLIKHVEDRKGHDRRYAVNSSKIRFTLGWGTKTTLKDGLRTTVEWFVENNALQT